MDGANKKKIMKTKKFVCRRESNYKFKLNFASIAGNSRHSKLKFKLRLFKADYRVTTDNNKKKTQLKIRNVQYQMAH